MNMSKVPAVTFRTKIRKAKVSDGRFVKLNDRVMSATLRADGTYFSLPGRVVAFSESHGWKRRTAIRVSWTNGITEDYYGEELKKA